MLYLHWRTDRPLNFGDRVAPVVFEHLTGHAPIWVPERCQHRYVTLTGSFLHIISESAVVWGSGVLHSLSIPQPRATYCAVRGPHTRQRILAHGGTCPEAYGDPVSLLPRIFPATPNPRYLGVVPHWREKGMPLYQGITDPQVRVLDIEVAPREFIASLTECEVVLSSSLHGIVAAHAYGIPAVWIRPSNRPLGDGIKFLDYLDAVGSSQPTDLKPESQRDLLAMSHHAVAPRLDLEDFMRACPLRSSSPPPDANG